MANTNERERRSSDCRKLCAVARDRGALSPIFATLIILAIVTVLFIPVFIWATGTTSQTQSFWLFSGQTATERIVIEEINLVGGQAIPKCTIYVRNIGKTAITINDIIVTNQTASPPTIVGVYQGSTFVATPNSVTQGNLITIEIPDLRPYFPVNETTYTIQVFTTRGVGDSYQIKVLWFTP